MITMRNKIFKLILALFVLSGCAPTIVPDGWVDEVDLSFENEQSNAVSLAKDLKMMAGKKERELNALAEARSVDPDILNQKISRLRNYKAKIIDLEQQAASTRHRQSLARTLNRLTEYANKLKELDPDL